MRRRNVVRTLVVLVVGICVLSGSGAEAAAASNGGSQSRLRPAKRSYDTHAYYVMELVDGSSMAEAADLAGRLGAELVEQVGELRDHWLLRAEFGELVKRNSESHDDDNVMKRYYDLRMVHAGQLDWRMAAAASSNNGHRDLLSKLTAARSVPGTASANNIISLEKQVIKKRVKRQLPVIPPGTVNGLPQGATGATTGMSAYLSDLAMKLGIADPMWPKQWHLANDQMRDNSINVTGVWEQGITGKGVKVAIVDDGLDMHSNDLMDNFFADGSWDYNDHTDLPEPRLSDDQHGTRCAGEIAAAKNDVCGVGVAYNAKVSGIRILSASISDADEASALNFGYQENDIYSCSWGPPDDGRSMEAPSRLIYKSMLNGVQNGRGGKGSVFVFASGNGGAVDDQCNFDGYTNSIFSITISAIDRKGLHPYYSEGCSANMVVTYSSGSGDNIHTTDVGENKCTHHHGGTSAAAPIAAGIFALALEVRPDLTWRDLQHICVQSAIQVNVNDPDWQLTHAGRPYNHKYGYGKLDAYRIVDYARTWETVKPQAWYEAPKMVVGKPLTEKGVSSSFEVASDSLDLANFEKLEHITVTVKAKHMNRGNMEVVLESPNGVKSILARPRRFDHNKDGFPDWTFMSVKHWDENPVGNWTLTMLDKQNNGKNGTFENWSMIFWGSAIDASSAVAYKMPNDAQVHLPIPPHHSIPAGNVTVSTTTIVNGGSTRIQTTTLVAHEGESTKSYAKPTAHLPGDHAEVTGESDHPLDGLPTVTSTTDTAAPTALPVEDDEAQSDSEDLEYLGPWSTLADSSTWFYIAAGSVIIFLGAAGAYFVIRRRQQQGRGSWLGGYSTVSGREDDGHPMSALERGRLRLLGGGSRPPPSSTNQPGRTRALYDAFALSDSEDEEREENRGLVQQERRVDDSYMSSFLEDEDDEERGPRQSTPSPQQPNRQQSSDRYRDEDDLDDNDTSGHLSR